jgi:hypothetical protein
MSLSLQMPALRAGVKRRLPSSIPACTRFFASAAYFRKPVPSLTLADVQGLAQTQAGRNTRGSRGVHGPRLTLEEGTSLGAARASGVLFMTAQAHSQQLCNSFFRFCWERSRAYVAVDKLGREVVVDLSPLQGLAKKPELVAAGAARVAAAREAAAASLWASQRAAPALQLVNDATLEAQAAASLPGPSEGSNAVKRPDVAPGVRFTLIAPSRDAARAAALALGKALGAPGERDARAASAHNAAARSARALRVRDLMLRRLQRLAADENAVKQLLVPQGQLAGYLAAVAAGEVVRVPAARGAAAGSGTPPAPPPLQ